MSSWFYPRALGDPGADRNARTLQLACLLLACAIGLIAALTAFNRPSREIPLLLLGIAGLAAAMALNRAGHWRWAARMAVAAVLLVAILLVVVSRDGFRSHAMLFFPSMLLIGVMLLDRRSYLTVAGVVLLAVAGLGIAEINGLLGNNPTERTPPQYTSVFFVDLGLLVFALIGSRIARDVEHNVLDLRHSVDHLTSANTELSQAADALRDSEAQARARAAELQAIMDAAPVAIFIAPEPACEQMTANRAAYKLLRQPDGVNLSLTAPKGQAPSNFRVTRNGVEIPRSELPIQCAARTGRAISDYEERLVFDDGGYVDVVVNAEPLLDDEGRARGAVGAITDVTEAKLSQQAWRQSEERFGSLFENATVGIYRTTPSGRVEAANPALLQMLGYDCFDTLAQINLEEQGFEPTYPRSEFRRHLERDGQIRGLEAAWVRRDGSTVYVRESARCVRDDSGVVQYYEGIVEDITDRKRAEDELRDSEARFRGVVETSQDAISFIDGSGFVLYRSPSCELLDGYTAEERLGKRSCELVHPDDMEAVLGALRALADGSQTTLSAQYRIQRRDGAWRWVETVGRSLLDNPSVRAIVVATVDITERTQAEAEKELLERQLAHAQKMESVGRLAGGIAHDFNNLLSVVLLHADSALDELAAGESPADSLTSVRDAAGKAVTLGQQLMVLSSKQPAQTEVLDLNFAIAENKKLLTRLIGEDVRVVFNPAPRPLYVNADRGQLSQVIFNLAVNSRDAMPEGGVFTLETTNVAFSEADTRRNPAARPGSYILMTVRDTGSGMDQETQARIFEPFFSTKEFGKGTGLGLSIVYGIVKQCGGFIIVESEPGRGSEFRIFLPEALQTSESVATKAKALAVGGSETILLAEDEGALREKVRHVLEHAGYRVLAAADGDETMLLAAENPGPIHLLLTDVVMPGLSGPAVAERVRSIRPQAKVLFMSGYPEAGGASMDLGFLPKPFTRETLLRHVREALDSGSASAVSAGHGLSQSKQ